MTWQWICGFYEGEGGPSYTQSASRKSGKKSKKRLRLIISQKERPLLKRCQKFLKRVYGQKALVHVYPRRSSLAYHRGCMAKLMIDGETALSFAEAILPMMQSAKKRRQLETALRRLGLTPKLPL